jgi:iron-sulfur cluster repair protein YtfE (RIC family)
MAIAVANADHDRYLGLSETLNMLMQQHNLKEENMLYPMSDQVLGGARDEVIHSVEAMPVQDAAP